MKIKLSLLALLAQFFSFTAMAYDAKIGDLYYKFTGTEATVTYQSYNGYYANTSYTYLKDVVIPNKVTYKGKNYDVTCIGDHAFFNMYNSSLTSITIPESVTKIDEWAFAFCGDLTSVTIPNSVTTIGRSAFTGCGLTSVTIGNSVTSIDDAFSNCSSLTSVTIGNTVTSIIGSFSGCISLTSITIPESVTNIGNGAFADCRSLTSINIPKNVTSIGASAFENCRSLTSIILPESVTSIGASAFENCRSLTSSIAIPNGVISIANNTFKDCSSMISVTIPKSVTSIGSSAFSGCSGLTSVTIPNSVTSIGNWAFGGCSSLTSVTISASVTSIGWDVFNYCSNLKDVYCLAEILPDNNSSFFYLSSATLYVPASAIDEYKTTEPWSGFGDIVALEEGTERQVTLSAAGYATFYDGQASYTLPKGLSACVVTAANDQKLTYQTIAEGAQSGCVPKGVAVVLKSDKRQTGTFTLTRTTEEKVYDGQNLLRGRDVSTMTYATEESYFYKLSYGNSGSAQEKAFGWYWGATDGSAFMMEDHKAWLAIPKSTAVKALFYGVEGEVTGIVDLNGGHEDSTVIYDLQGRRIAKPLRRGIYICNGQKTIIQ